MARIRVIEGQSLNVPPCERTFDLACRMPHVHSHRSCRHTCKTVLGCANYSFYPDDHTPPTMRGCVLFRGRELMCQKNCSLPWNASMHVDSPDEIPWLSSTTPSFEWDETGSVYIPDDGKRFEPKKIALCMVGIPRAFQHPAVWSLQKRMFEAYDKFLVVTFGWSYGTSRRERQSDIVNATALATAINGLQPLKARFIGHESEVASQVHCERGQMLQSSFEDVIFKRTLQHLTLLRHCHEIIESTDSYDVIVKTRLDLVWFEIPRFDSVLETLPNTVITKNDYVVVVPRDAFDVLSKPLTCSMKTHECERGFLKELLPKVNAYCHLKSQFAEFNVSHLECAQPGEREWFGFPSRENPWVRGKCAFLNRLKLVRWQEALEIGFKINAKQHASLVCHSGSTSCERLIDDPLWNPTRGYIDVEYERPPLPRSELDPLATEQIRRIAAKDGERIKEEVFSLTGNLCPTCTNIYVFVPAKEILQNVTFAPPSSK